MQMNNRTNDYKVTNKMLSFLLYLISNLISPIKIPVSTLDNKMRKNETHGMVGGAPKSHDELLVQELHKKILAQIQGEMQRHTQPPHSDLAHSSVCDHLQMTCMSCSQGDGILCYTAFCFGTSTDFSTFACYYLKDIFLKRALQLNDLSCDASIPYSDALSSPFQIQLPSNVPAKARDGDPQAQGPWYTCGIPGWPSVLLALAQPRRLETHYVCHSAFKTQSKQTFENQYPLPEMSFPNFPKLILFINQITIIVVMAIDSNGQYLSSAFEEENNH